MPSVKMFCDWDHNSAQLIDLLENQTKDMSGGVYRDLQFTAGEDYDYSIVFNFPRNLSAIKTPPHKTFGLLLEPPEIINLMYGQWKHARTVPGVQDMYSFSTASPFPYMPGLGFCSTEPNTRFVDPHDKSRVACMIASNKRFTPYHGKRHEVLRALMKSDLPIDFYGRGMPPSDDPRVKGEIPPRGKAPVLDLYRYVIDFENSPHGVVTDKYFDAVMRKSIPITNALMLNEFGTPHSYRVVDFEQPTDAIVRRIGDILFGENMFSRDERAVFAQNAQEQFTAGKFSLARWIHGKVHGNIP